MSDYTDVFDRLWGSCRDVFAGVPRDERGVPALTRDEVRDLLAEGKRIADKRRKAREARERDPERAR